MDSQFNPIVPVTDDGSNHKKIGPIITTFVTIIVIIALALYLFASKSNNQQLIPNDNSSVATEQSSAGKSSGSIQTITNTSDDVQSIQNDLNNSTIGIDSQNF
jgi:uncharacterized membrane protein YjfL (UPF0719 family)